MIRDDEIAAFLQREIGRHSRILNLLESALRSYRKAGAGLWLKFEKASAPPEEQIQLTVKGSEDVAQVMEALHESGYEVKA